jgi:hypothetical protein
LRSSVTLYRIHVRQFADRSRSWCVLRRYSEFFELRETLARTVAPLPELPPKLVLNMAESLAELYLELDAFLRALLAVPAAAAHARLRSFLGADGAVAPWPQAGSQSSSEGLTSIGTAGSGSSAVRDDDDDDLVVDDDDDDHVAVDEPLDGTRGSVGGGGDGGGSSSRWLLTGTWIADEERSDSAEPLLIATGTAWGVRRMLRGLVFLSELYMNMRT